MYVLGGNSEIWGAKTPSAAFQHVEPLRMIIDKCGWCGLIWLDKDELEILQYVYEKFR